MEVWTKIRVGDILLIEEKRIKNNQCWGISDSYTVRLYSEFGRRTEL